MLRKELEENTSLENGNLFLSYNQVSGMRDEITTMNQGSIESQHNRINTIQIGNKVFIDLNNITKK